MINASSLRYQSISLFPNQTLITFLSCELGNYIIYSITDIRAPARQTKMVDYFKARGFSEKNWRHADWLGMFVLRSTNGTFRNKYLKYKRHSEIKHQSFIIYFLLFYLLALISKHVVLKLHFLFHICYYTSIGDYIIMILIIITYIYCSLVKKNLLLLITLQLMITLCLLLQYCVYVVNTILV